MTNRTQIASLIGATVHGGSGAIPDGDEILTALEDAGYAVVPAGLVPDVDSFRVTEARLIDLAEVMSGIRTKCTDAASLLQFLRDVACIVLDVDPSAGEPGEELTAEDVAEQTEPSP